MATGIPLPGPLGETLMKGFDTGSSMFQRYMQPVVEREQLAQRAKQFEQELALRQAAAGRAAALAPLQKALLQAQAQSAIASAKKSQILADLMNGGANSSENTSNQDDSKPNITPTTFPGIGEGNPFEPENNNGSYQNVSYNQESNMPVISSENQESPAYKLAGMSDQGMGKEIILNQGNQRLSGLDRAAGIGGIPKVQTHYDNNGNLITRYPSGKVTMTRVGANAEETARNKGFGKYQGESYGNAVDTSLALGEQQANLERIADQLERYPNPDQVIGPVNKVLTTYFGNPNDKKLLGDIMATTGNVVLEAAKNIKGAFTGRDQSLINSMKPNASDPYWVFLGKLRGMGELASIAQKRADIYADLLHANVAPHRAIKIAQEQTKLEPVTDKYEKLIKNAEQKNLLAEGKMPSFSSQEEAQGFLQGLSEQQKLKMLSMMGQK